MRVLMTADTIGGVWTYTMELAAQLCARGVEVEVLALGGHPAPRQWAQARAVEGLSVRPTDLKLEWQDDPWADVEFAGDLLQQRCRAWRPHLVHLNNFGQALRPTGCPTLLALHSCVATWWRAVKGEALPASWARYRRTVQAAASAADALVAPTAAFARALADEYALTRPIRVVHNGCEPHDAGSDAILVHEWNPPELIARIGAAVDRARAAGSAPVLLFHDTHHRSVSAPRELDALDLTGYDGALVFGDVIRQRYAHKRWARQAWTWHEAADVSVFHPLPDEAPRHDLVWIGNWGDDERAAELDEFLIEPVKELGLDATVYGVRYPQHALAKLRAAGIRYGGYLANHRAPLAYARHRLTVHVPRRFYRQSLPGVPTIRPFEALACGVPLLSAPWRDSEGLFRAGDFTMVLDGVAMRRAMQQVLADPDAARRAARRGVDTIQAAHTCGHRVRELLALLTTLGAGRRRRAATLGVPA